MERKKHAMNAITVKDLTVRFGEIDGLTMFGRLRGNRIYGLLAQRRG